MICIDYYFALFIFVGVQFKRVEALTRSQTLLEVKNTQNAALTFAEEVEKYPVSHSASHSHRDRLVCDPFRGRSFVVIFSMVLWT